KGTKLVKLNNFEVVCRAADRVNVDQVNNLVSIVALRETIFLWRKGSGLFSCPDGQWRLDEEWNSRGAGQWSALVLNPSYPSHFLAVAGTTLRVFAAGKEVASITRSELVQRIGSVVGVKDCEFDGPPSEYKKGTISFRCGLDRR